MKYNKIKIAVLFGGASSEHEVSCASAANVLSIISDEKYDVYKLGILKDGSWVLTDASIDEIKSCNWAGKSSNRRAYIAPDSQIKGIVVENGEQIKLDAAFPVLHGKNGEDGAIAALLQLAGIDNITTSMTSAAACMDKVITKQICDNVGIPQCKWAFFYSEDVVNNIDSVVLQIEKGFAYPIFIKPANAGSSVGISKCTDRQGLLKALNIATCHDFKILVEENIIGKEIETAVIGNSNPVVSCCGEIVPHGEFYTYDSKYNDDRSKLFIPARIRNKTSETVRDIALKVYKAMDCTGLARVDFFVTDSDEVIFNEINTIPGFTNISMYPKLMAQMGLGGQLLADKLIENALQGDKR